MDLCLATALMLLLSGLALRTGMHLAGRASRQVQLTVQLLVLVVGTIFLLCFWNRPILTAVVPHTALIVLENWHGVFGCFLAGMYMSSMRVGRRRRLIVGSFTTVLAVYAIIAPITGRAPTCQPDDPRNILVSQTTPWTCSPAVAASLLRLHGIPATEAGMARLCLTRRGTHWLGLFRGLKLMTAGTEWDVLVEAYSPSAIAALNSTPAILSVNIDTDGMGPTAEHGFRPNAGHSVLHLGGTHGEHVIVFDPAPEYGIEKWSDDILSHVTTGVILRLVSRDAHARQQEVARRVQRFRRTRRTVAQVSFTTQPH